MSYSRVKEIIGITENELVNTSDREKYIEDIDGKLYFINGEKKVPIGDFSIYSIKNLRDKILYIPQSDDTTSHSKRGSSNGKRNCTFTILKNVDIGVLQSTLKTEDKALVQVASNFNCLEVPNRRIYPECGNLVDNADKDDTQGPAACFGPLAAYLYRTHFVFNNREGQTFKKQIELLENVERYFGKCVNGKLTLNNNESPITNIDAVVNAIKIGLHTDVSVIYGRDEHGTNYELDEPYQLIDQCFNSTINMNDYDKLSTDKFRIICRTLLCAAYESVYLSAMIRQRRNLYLTMIGGGAFSNPQDIIIEELIRAHQTWSKHYLSSLENVYLCLYDDNESIISKFANL